MKSRLSVSAAAACLLGTAPALAAPFAGFTSGFERVEILTHSSLSTKLSGVEQTSNSWHVGLGTQGISSYSIPRVSLEYTWEGGLSVGVCAGLMVSWKRKDAPNVYIAEPRLGYQFELGHLILWPKVGLTLQQLKGPDATRGALTLEVPLLSGRDTFGSFSLGPFLDLGLGGSQGDADQSLTEFGLALGFQTR